MNQNVLDCLQISLNIARVQLTFGCHRSSMSRRLWLANGRYNVMSRLTLLALLMTVGYLLISVGFFLIQMANKSLIDYFRILRDFWGI